MHENVSEIHQSAFSALYAWPSEELSSFGFKTSEQNPFILQSIELGNVTFVYLSPNLNLQRKGGEILYGARKRNLSGKFDRLWMKSIVLPSKAAQVTARIVQLFVCDIFVTLTIFTSSVWNLWPRIADVFLRVSHVVAGADERRLYSQPTDGTQIKFLIKLETERFMI